MNRFTHLLVFIGLLILWGMAPSKAHACTYNLNFTGPASISVDPSIPVGSVLWGGNVTSPATSDPTQCVAGTFDLVTEGSTAYLGNNLYATNIPGVAARMRMATNCATGEWFPSTCRLGLGGPTFSWPAQTMVFQFVKTGPVGSGSLSGVFGRWRITSSYPQVYTTLSWARPIQVVLTTPTCSVNANSTQTVNLGNYTAGQFTGVGSMTPPQAFNINFNCAGGTAGGTRNIYITMTDATVPANRTSNLNLAPGSTAGGVAVRIQRNGGATDVLFGADSADIGNANQWLAGTVATGTGTFAAPLQARMVQTGTVATGSVSAKATFTVAYN
ncbi:fimbrial protein [Dyella flava]|uniref:Fimbrial protein n=1 Tax=Dyella flava TaxID=1920170 RepID=A0ABS2K629_9GAMM|nr:fimbrial protein [Dyella flava]MBM7126644.1 fimbrial protein [Dyella flava]GLQ49535.1 fimbrial protein [Dyella flava]